MSSWNRNTVFTLLTQVISFALIAWGQVVFQSHFELTVAPDWLLASPIGLGIAGAFLVGWRVIPGLILGSLAGVIWLGTDPWAVMTGLTGELAGTLSAILVLRFWARRPMTAQPFEVASSVWAFTLVVAVASFARGFTTCVASLVFATDVGQYAVVGSTAMVSTAMTWAVVWMFTPGLLVWLDHHRLNPLSRKELLEFFALQVLAALFMGLCFADSFVPSLTSPTVFLVIVLVLSSWVALRLQVAGVVVLLWVVGGVAVTFGAMHGESSRILPISNATELSLTLVGIGWVAAYHLVVAATVRQDRLRQIERDSLYHRAQEQAERLRVLNAQLAAQSLELTNQAGQVQDQRDQFESLARELAEKQAWLEAVIEHIPVGLMLVDAHGKVIGRNHHFNNILQLREEGADDSVEIQLSQLTLENAAGSPLAEAERPLTLALRDGLTSHQMELHLERRDGTAVDISASASPIRVIDGEIVGAILAIVDLGPVREAERRAKENEDRLRFALRAAGMIAWEWDIPGNAIRRSEPLEQLLGLSADSRTEEPGFFQSLIHADDREEYLETVRRVRAGEISEFISNYRLRHASGSYICIESRGRVRWDHAGRPSVVTGIMIDVTERRLNEERLRLLESAVVHARDAIIVLEAEPRDERGRSVLYVNDAFTELTGYPRDEAVGRSLHYLRGPETSEETLESMRIALDEFQHFKGELLNYRKDGSEIWVDVSLVPVHGDGFHPNHFVMIQRDINDRKKTEEALRQSEAMFRGFFESTAAGVSVTGPDGQYLACNPAYAAMLGRGVDEIIGHHPREFTHPEDYADQIDLVRELHDGIRDSYQIRKRYIRPDGSTVSTELSVTTVRSAHEAFLYGLGVSVDVTARWRLEEQLRQSQKMEALGQLAGGVAHDFNNLLTAVLGNLALVKLTPEDPNRQLLRTVEQAAGRAADLTRKLLGYARRNQLLLTPVKPSDLIAEVVDFLRRTLDPRIEIVISIKSEETCLADATLLNQALFNLCLNARDVMPEGGRLELGVELLSGAAHEYGGPVDARPGPYLCMSVNDTGPGIPEDIRTRLFEPFFTTKDVGRGTGLGLPMVLGIMHQHRGWVHVHSQVGVGSRFDLIMPLQSQTDQATQLQANRMLGGPNGPTHPTDGDASTILLVDDESMIRELARAILESAGHKVYEAEDGADAVKQFQQYHDEIDLIIMDLTMPRLSGRDAYHQITQMAPRTRVLFSSGYSADDISELEGTCGLLAKPYRPADLLIAVHNALTDGTDGVVSPSDRDYTTCH